MKIYLALACAVCSLTATAQTQFGGNYPNNRLPLAQKEYIALPLGNIRAEGWLKEQLIRMKDGLTGHLDQVYEPVMGKRNGWLGGDGDVWERGPYWIDGLLPLAYILDDKELIAKVQPWIEWTLKSQKENGFFGPDTDRPNEPGLQRDNAKDWWPRMVVLKVMQQYYMATRDERVIAFLTKYFRYQLDELPKTPLGKWTYWGEQRGGDNLMVVYWLYNHTGEKFLLDLAELIHRLDRRIYGNRMAQPPTQPPLRKPRTRLQGTGHILPAKQKPRTPQSSRQGRGANAPHHRTAHRALGRRRTAALRFARSRIGTVHCRGNDVLARKHTRNNRQRKMGRLPGTRGIQRSTHADNRRFLGAAVLPAIQPGKHHPRMA